MADEQEPKDLVGDPPPAVKKARQTNGEDHHKPFSESTIADYRRRKNKKDVLPFVLSWDGNYKYTSLKDLPPVEIDQEGYAIRPRPIRARRRALLKTEERQVRWLLMYNFSGGNEVLACMEAGCSREDVKVWMKGAIFKAAFEKSKKDIGARAHMRVMQVIGMMRKPEGLKVHEAALIAFARKFSPEMFDPEAQPQQGRSPDDEPQAEPDIPRPPKS